MSDWKLLPPKIHGFGAVRVTPFTVHSAGDYLGAVVSVVADYDSVEHPRSGVPAAAGKS